MNNNLSLQKIQERIPAKASGYSFGLYDKQWQLDKNVKVNLFIIHRSLSGSLLNGCLKTLEFYAKNLSSSHTKNIIERFQHFLLATKTDELNEVAFINYRASLSASHEWYLATIRGFLKRWHALGYYGVNEEVIRLLDSWRLKGNRKGDAIKRQDPTDGPLTDNELQAFNEGVVRAYEKGLITLSELALSLVISNTGRRPIQISHLRFNDVKRGSNKKNEPLYLLNVPRGKQGDGFRASFKPFALTEELWAVLNAQAKSAVYAIRNQLGVDVPPAIQQQIPIFPDIQMVATIASIENLQELIKGDKLHITSANISRVLQFVVEVAKIRSERTGTILEINARRFRYTTGTRAAREGFGELVIAELLDHSDTQNTGVYIKNIPEHVKRLDEAVGIQMAPYAQAFAGVLVDSERDAKRGDDPSSRIRTDEGNGIGTCGEYGFCGGNVPIPCYTCMHFQPWLNGPHEEVYKGLISQRERIKEVTGDMTMAAVLDRSIIAVADVILRCNKRKEDIEQQEQC